jgi:SAM-dependent methyltransferase
MGLVLNSLKFLLESHKSGVRFDEVLTLGRQHMTLSPERAVSLLQDYKLWPPPGGEEMFLAELKQAKWRFEVFARSLGAKNVSSMDISDYEQATIVHDLNFPTPANLHEKFDVVIDGGTLEHVFHVPVAMENCMKITKTGGHIVIITNTNNLVGHGFYQFSPELFYRIFSSENGFEVKRMVALEDTFGRSSLFGVKYDFPIQGPWYEVHDPDKVRKRNILITREPVVLLMLAKKIANVPIFKTVPRQSEYGADDQSVLNPTNQSRFGRSVISSLLNNFPEKFWREWLPRAAGLVDPFRVWRHHRRNSFGNKDFYTKAKE